MKKSDQLLKTLGEFFLEDSSSVKRYSSSRQQKMKYYGNIAPFILDKPEITKELLNLFPFCIFSIYLKDEIFSSFMVLKNSMLLEKWEDCLTKSSHCKKIPLLLFTRTKYEWYLLLDATISNFPESLNIPSAYLATVYKGKNYRNYVLTTVKLKDFIEVNKNNTTFNLLKTRYKILRRQNEQNRS